MPGETDLDVMLAGLSPELEPTEYVYATVPIGVVVPVAESAVVRVAEAEGTTLVLPVAEAIGLGLQHEFPCQRITLRVHSDLAAVGLTAAISTALAAEGLPANVVAGFWHDHVFVPADRAADAHAVLLDLTAPATLRTAIASDEADLWRMLRHAAWADDGEQPETDPYLRRYVEGWGRPGDAGIVAIGPSGRVIGAAFARALGALDGGDQNDANDRDHGGGDHSHDTDDVPELAIGTIPSQRGRGLGGRMLEALLTEMAAAGHATLRLDVRDTNPAIRLYERLGFERTRTRTNRVGTTSIVMERALRPGAG
ncbi:MAG: ACT domain-containing protein [Actinomycetota bacterium]|nr:ACT domain-containing protein [Actinomycetota bacterium]